MTADEEDLIRQLCAKAAMVMEGTIAIALSPLEETGDLLLALEALTARSKQAAKLIAAALALTED